MMAMLGLCYEEAAVSYIFPTNWSKVAQLDTRQKNGLANAETEGNVLVEVWLGEEGFVKSTTWKQIPLKMGSTLRERLSANAFCVGELNG